MFETIKSIIDPQVLVTSLGLAGVIAIVFLETGAFFGFFFPGDSLLITAGFFASKGYLPIAVLLIGTVLAAILGDSLGYAFGKRIGPALFTKEDSFWFNKKHIVRAQHFYEKHGKKTIILARFVPIIRTFAPIIAGIGTMRYRDFITFNIIGGLLWTWSMLLFGYIFGSIIPNASKYITFVVIGVIIISAIPALREIYKEAKDRYKKL